MKTQLFSYKSLGLFMRFDSYIHAIGFLIFLVLGQALCAQHFLAYKNDDGTISGIVIDVANTEFLVKAENNRTFKVKPYNGLFRVISGGVWSDKAVTLTNVESQTISQPIYVARPMGKGPLIVDHIRHYITYGATLNSKENLTNCYAVFQWYINNSPAFGVSTIIGDVPANKPVWFELERDIEAGEKSGTYSIHIFSGSNELHVTGNKQDKYWPDKPAPNDPELEAVLKRRRTLEIQIGELESDKRLKSSVDARRKLESLHAEVSRTYLEEDKIKGKKILPPFGS